MDWFPHGNSLVAFFASCALHGWRFSSVQFCPVSVTATRFYVVFCGMFLVGSIYCPWIGSAAQTRWSVGGCAIAPPSIACAALPRLSHLAWAACCGVDVARRGIKYFFGGALAARGSSTEPRPAGTRPGARPSTAHAGRLAKTPGRTGLCSSADQKGGARRRHYKMMA